MKELAEIFPYIGIYYLSLFMGLLVNGMPLLASLIFSLILILIVLWVWSFIYLTMFCLESKIRHSTIVGSASSVPSGFCLESKIRHSTILSCPQPHTPAFCLESKIRHSTMNISV